MGDNINTSYDDVFRTLLNDCPDLIIPVVNDTFGTDYVMGRDEVRKGNNEFFFTKQDTGQDDIVSDSHIMIGDKQYHIECQSTQDGSMVVRMFEYDVQIAMQHAEKSLDRYTIRFPQSAVLYLRSTKNTPDHMEIRIEVPGDSCMYHLPVLKIKNYSVEDIFQRKLYFLIPFYIFCYEAFFGQCETDDARLEQLADVFGNIRIRLYRLTENGEISEYYQKTILTMSEKVIKNIAKKYQKTSERIGDIMGGKILEYEAKTIMNEGRTEGRKEGVAEGQTLVFINMIKRGFSMEDAMSIAEITKEQADKAIADMERQG